jgi:hypothetical protein
MMQVFHWWPGRTWKKECPIPMYLVKRAEELGSKYLTVAIEYVPAGDEDIPLVGTAFCCWKDAATRTKGREIAVGRLRKEIEWYRGAPPIPRVSAFCYAFNQIDFSAFTEWAKNFHAGNWYLTSTR